MLLKFIISMGGYAALSYIEKAVYIRKIERDSAENNLKIQMYPQFKESKMMISAYALISILFIFKDTRVGIILYLAYLCLKQAYTQIQIANKTDISNVDFLHLKIIPIKNIKKEKVYIKFVLAISGVKNTKIMQRIMIQDDIEKNIYEISKIIKEGRVIKYIINENEYEDKKQAMIMLNHSIKKLASNDKIYNLESMYRLQEKLLN